MIDVQNVSKVYEMPGESLRVLEAVNLQVSCRMLLMTPMVLLMPFKKHFQMQRLQGLVQDGHGFVFMKEDE